MNEENKKEMGSKTALVRIDRDMYREIKMKFPNYKNKDLFRFMYDTSLLKLEGKLRK